ncbi:URC4/urg3 family protein [Paenibacillus sp. TRM 82003]|nr:URC4/urg3 family protein [Paenibacillus sp. TRM 82003]MCI3923481.1 URC4/urg3 family protein [Paenibacillus sp. TRM 82003]
MIASLLAKLLERLPFHKLTPFMTYSLSFNVLLTVFMTVLVSTDTKFRGFPNAWDYRMMLLVNVAVFAIGVLAARRRRRK